MHTLALVRKRHFDGVALAEEEGCGSAAACVEKPMMALVVEREREKQIDFLIVG